MFLLQETQKSSSLLNMMINDHGSKHHACCGASWDIMLLLIRMHKLVNRANKQWTCITRGALL